MSTYMANNQNVECSWYVVDAADKTLGRLASEIAQYIRGKHKPTFTPHVDMGDYVIVVNAEKIKLTGKKWDDKKHYSHTNHPGGINEITYKELRVKDPEFIIEKAVKGMLPHNKLGRKMLKKLKVYSGPNHPHQAQQPEKLEL
ncbi:MAG: large subunit ribosomal protein L13 [Halanaerobium sp. 4-GBenrich]|uniref:Large ribosomal subunit protein uL13 n=1 Tax=Halanaerobium congolense TaxID=54121 RepID=A0A1G6Q4R2_9FIRM|nr:50S ribosomal protein L13 [Halanaerobium congolense]KXS48390.1 MAG: large subunit ribosomal protein L13 [Halanaerobium sp. T82-1]ODS50768.1 MAG: large subunit ribosomal protein L13 [Halanaerobium sp. 4-GBenrich]PUU92871.1 MAG: large subunit ribosomal protein L13 [Halanaerobium sp.]PTX15527.1 LSU ribosomal protein L13P [Halanaerobium congolense]PXV63889.1 LSU ribosomal protein L13P [Halanaerobium congolense]